MSVIAPSKDSQSFLTKFYKGLTLLIFLLLPSKISHIFVNLSILAIIYEIRNMNFCVDKINIDKIHELLKITISDDILLLPNYTIHWFWDEDFLNTKTVIDNKEYTLREIIKDSELFFSHIRTVLNMFINHLPGILKFKLGVSDIKNRLRIKHNLISILVYS